MKIQLKFGVISLFIIFGLIFPLGEKRFSYRLPAAVDDDSCFSLAQSLLRNRDSKFSSLFSKFQRSSGESKFNIEKFKLYRERYIQLAKEGSLEELQIDRNSESLLAVIEAQNFQKHIEIGPSLEQLSTRKLNSLADISKKLTDNKSLRPGDLEKSISEIYSIVLGPSFSLKNSFGESGKRNILFRLFAEDAAVNGLLPVLKKYKVFKDPSKYQKLMSFFDSKKGKALLTGVFNFPIIWGMPPFYLPGLKKIRIPHQLAKEAMEKGLTEELADKMVKVLNEDLVAHGSFKLETRAKYELFRKYYMYGIGALTVYIMYSDFQMAEQYRVENEVYEEAMDDVEERMVEMEELEARGFDIFEDSSNVQNSTLSNSFCRAVEDCLNSEKNNEGVLPEPDSEIYKACKEFMDPEKKCEKY